MRSASTLRPPALPRPRAARQPRSGGTAGDTGRARAGRRARTFRSAATGGARVSSACRARAGASWLCASRQQPTRRLEAGGCAAWWRVCGGVVGGWRRRRWSHTAEERWAWRWRRICEAAVRARRRQGRGWVHTLWGAVEAGGGEPQMVTGAYLLHCLPAWTGRY